MQVGSDAIMFASAMLGGIYSFRRKVDFIRVWRESVHEALSSYLPPMDGLKMFLLQCVEEIPLHVDPQYKEEFDSHLALYRESISEEGALSSKRIVQEDMYRQAIEYFQHLSFSEVEAEDPDDGTVTAKVARLRLQKGVVEYDEGRLLLCLEAGGWRSIEIVDAPVYEVVRGEDGYLCRATTIHAALHRAASSVEFMLKGSSDTLFSYFWE